MLIYHRPERYGRDLAKQHIVLSSFKQIDEAGAYFISHYRTLGSNLEASFLIQLETALGVNVVHFIYKHPLF
jgi:hypothetical protein